MTAWLDIDAPARWSGTDLTAAATTLAVALGCGLLIGIERERRKGSGPGRALGGLRTFALTCVTGAAAALTGLTGLVVAGAALVVALTAVAYWRDRSDDPGVTTEVALLLTYLVGVLSSVSPPLAAGLAAGLTVMLAARERLHRFVHHWLTPAEVRDGIVLAALVLLALPLVPDRALWGTALNPKAIVRLLAVLLSVQALAHLARRLLAARHAVVLSSLASGFVSSTATIATQVQMLLVATAMQPAWLAHLWLSALVAAAAAAAWAAWLLRAAPGGGRADAPAAAGDDRMFSLKGALVIVALLAGIQALVQALSLWLGDAGLLAGALIGALADLHAALAAVFAAGPPAPATHRAVVLALLVHAASKTVAAGVAGGWPYLRWLAPGLWVHTALGVAVLVVL